MPGGKKAKRGRTAKKKQAEAAVTAVKRNTAFIETSDGPDRVLPIEVRKVRGSLTLLVDAHVMADDMTTGDLPLPPAGPPCQKTAQARALESQKLRRLLRLPSENPSGQQGYLHRR